MTPDDLPAELRAELDRLMRWMPANWRAGTVTPGQGRAFVVSIVDEVGRNTATVILWPDDTPE
jgi:hypothetical protein